MKRKFSEKVCSNVQTLLVTQYERKLAGLLEGEIYLGVGLIHELKVKCRRHEGKVFFIERGEREWESSVYRKKSAIIFFIG